MIEDNLDVLKVLPNHVYEWDFNNDYVPSRETLEFFAWENEFFENEYKSPPFHYFMCDALYDPNYLTKVFECFRGGAKSTLINTKNFLYWCYLGYKPNFGPIPYIFFASASLKLIVGHIGAIKEAIEDNPKLSAVLYVEKVNIDAYPVIIIRNKITGTRHVMEGKSPSQKVRGLRKGKDRASLLMLDDAESEESVRNSDAIEGFNEWLSGAIYPALISKEPEVIIIGTPLHRAAMLETKKNDINTLAIRVPACKNFNPNRVPKDEECAWADSLNGKSIINRYNFMKSGSGAIMFFQEYLLRLTSSEAAIFDTSLLQTYDVKKPYDTEVTRYVSLDASTGTVNGDYGSFMVVAVDKLGAWYIEDIVVGKFDTLETRDMIHDMCLKHNAALVMEEGIIFNMLLPMIELKQRETNRYFDILTVKRNLKRNSTKGGNSKIAVFKRLLPRLEAGKLFLPEECDFEDSVGWLIEQMDSITETRILSKHDDVIDSLAQLELLDEASVPEYTDEEYATHIAYFNKKNKANSNRDIVYGFR